MNLPDRIRLIISENNLSQNKFAKSISVTGSYISKLIRGDSGLSNSTAALIAERYGYNVDWIMNGNEPKMQQKKNIEELNSIQQKIIFEIEQMDKKDLMAVKSFISTLEEYKKALNINDED